MFNLSKIIFIILKKIDKKSKQDLIIFYDNRENVLKKGYNFYLGIKNLHL